MYNKEMKQNKNVNYLEIHETKYFNLPVRVFTIENNDYYKSFPWRYEIEFEGRLVQFSGIPNYVETRAKALKRAWYRAKWLSEGVFNNKYR